MCLRYEKYHTIVLKRNVLHDLYKSITNISIHFLSDISMVNMKIWLYSTIKKKPKFPHNRRLNLYFIVCIYFLKTKMLFALGYYLWLSQKMSFKKK